MRFPVHVSGCSTVIEGMQRVLSEAITASALISWHSEGFQANNMIKLCFTPRNVGIQRPCAVLASTDVVAE